MCGHLPPILRGTCLVLVGFLIGCGRPPEPEPTIRGKPLSQWLRSAQHADPRVRAEAVPALAEALTDQQGHVRPDVAAALTALGPEAEAAAPPLIQVLTATRGYDTSLAKKALVSIGPKAVPGLVQARAQAETHPNPSQSKAAIDGVLREIGAKAVPALITLLKEEDASVRTGAAEALKMVDPKAAARAGVP